MNVVEPPRVIAVDDALRARSVARSRQVEYLELQLCMSYWSWSDATSQRPNACMFQPEAGFVRE